MHGIGADPVPLGVHAWRARADDADRALLGHCQGPTLDVGCGPGRMADELRQMGVHATGIDVSSAAVRMSRRRGVVALLADIFAPLPAEGLWRTVLLADGNIGIGGDPVALLRRVALLLRPGGWVVVDVAPPGAGLATRTLALECGVLRSDPFPWTVVGADAVPGVAAAAGLHVDTVRELDGRWFAVMTKGP